MFSSFSERKENSWEQKTMKKNLLSKRLSSLLLSESSRAFPKRCQRGGGLGGNEDVSPHVYAEEGLQMLSWEGANWGAIEKVPGEEGASVRKCPPLLWIPKVGEHLEHCDPHIEHCHMWSLRACREDPSSRKYNHCIWDLTAMCICTQEEHKRIQSGTLVGRKEKDRREKWKKNKTLM